MASAMVWSAHSATVRVNGLKRWSRWRFIEVGCVLLALIGRTSTAEPPTAPEGPKAAADNQGFFGRTVVLPPYVVSAMRIDKHPWSYGSVPGFEVLTRASRTATCTMLDAVRRGLWIEDKLLPEDWRPPAPLPYTVIADNTDPKTFRATEPHVAPLVSSPQEDRVGWLPVASSLQTTSGWVVAGDPDTRALDANLYDIPTFFIAPQISLDRLDRCAPPLPPWLIAGLAGRRFGLFTGVALETHFGADIGVSSKVILRGARWVSTGETERLQKEVKTKGGHQIEIPFIPLGRFFTEPPPRAESRALWESEAALFVRWGFFDPKREEPAWRKAFVRWGLLDPKQDDSIWMQAFLQFVQRARYEPVTERMFTECFGCGFGAMEQILTDYLKEAIAQPVMIGLSVSPRFPEPELKPATADQSGRILGDWLRMQGRSIRERDPAMSAKFLDAAGRMLTRAYELDNGLPPDTDPPPQEARTSPAIPQKADGPLVRMKPFVVTAERIHDPGLLAVFGLYEHDIGDNAKAREFLEKAVKAGVVRPMADLVLARLRYAEAVAKPLGHDGKLSAPQAALILESAQDALRSSASVEAWRLIVGTLARCEAKPAALDIERIAGGVSRFPQDTHLALRAALLCVRSGNRAGAAKLIDQSLPFVTDEATKREFDRLRSALAVGSGSARNRADK